MTRRKSEAIIMERKKIQRPLIIRHSDNKIFTTTYQ